MSQPLSRRIGVPFLVAGSMFALSTLGLSTLGSASANPNENSNQCSVANPIFAEANGGIKTDTPIQGGTLFVEGVGSFTQDGASINYVLLPGVVINLCAKGGNDEANPEYDVSGSGSLPTTGGQGLSNFVFVVTTSSTSPSPSVSQSSSPSPSVSQSSSPSPSVSQSSSPSPSVSPSVITGTTEPPSSPAPSPSASTSPSTSPSASPSVAPSPISGTEEPPASPDASPPAPSPISGTEEPPASPDATTPTTSPRTPTNPSALPRTGVSSDSLLIAGWAALVAGFVMAVAGRRRSSSEV